MYLVVSFESGHTTHSFWQAVNESRTQRPAPAAQAIPVSPTASVYAPLAVPVSTTRGCGAERVLTYALGLLVFVPLWTEQTLRNPCVLTLHSIGEDSRLGTSYSEHRINEEELFTKIIQNATE